MEIDNSIRRMVWTRPDHLLNFQSRNKEEDEEISTDYFLRFIYFILLPHFFG